MYDVVLWIAGTLALSVAGPPLPKMEPPHGGLQFRAEGFGVWMRWEAWEGTGKWVRYFVPIAPMPREK